MKSRDEIELTSADTVLGLETSNFKGLRTRPASSGRVTPRGRWTEWGVSVATARSTLSFAPETMGDYLMDEKTAQDAHSSTEKEGGKLSNSICPTVSSQDLMRFFNRSYLLNLPPINLWTINLLYRR